MTDRGLTVGRLTGDDLGEAHALSADAGWATRRSDWRRMAALESIDAFAGRADGELVATATLVRYGARVGWIGMMLVDPARRRRGYGTRMLQACLAAAGRAGLDVVGLDATDEGEALYAKRGFLAVAATVRWRGTLPADGRPSPGGIERFEAADAVLELDRRASGVDRGFLLESLLGDPGTVGLLERPAGEVRGYAVLRPGGDAWTVGPFVASAPASADALLRAAGAAVEGDPVVANVAGNPRAGDLYRERGLERTRSLARMTHREPAEPLMGERVYGIPAFEYG